MKKLLSIIVLIFVSITLFSQEENEEKINSKSLHFLSKAGVFYKQEGYGLGSENWVNFGVIIVLDIVNNVKFGYVRLRHDRYVGILEPDEIDDCITATEYIKNTFFKSRPSENSRVIYKTKNGIEMRAYYKEERKESGWKVDIYMDEFISDSKETFNQEQFNDFIRMMKKAKTMILEKIAE